jgi:hypothetical protein
MPMRLKVPTGRRGIETYSGEFVDPLDPDPTKLYLRDIAHALSLICRFQGHVSRHYSVAEHSMYVADLLAAQQHDKRIVLTGLMHDASEAYMADLASPLKQDDSAAAYRAAEEHMMALLAKQFDFIWPLPQEVHHADRVLLWCEAHVLMHSHGTRLGGYEQEGRQLIEQHEDVCRWIADGRHRYNRSGRLRADKWIRRGYWLAGEIRKAAAASRARE